MDLWNQQLRDGCKELEVTRPLGVPGYQDHRVLRVQILADGWGNQGQEQSGHGVNLPSETSAHLHSALIHSLVHSFRSLSKYVFNAHEVPGTEQDMETQRGAGGHCPCPVLCVSRAASPHL